MKEFFITGTDTDAGKTHVTSLLLKLLAQHKRRAVGYKPIAAGAEMAFGELVNEDALTLMESSSVGAKYTIVNPFTYEPPIAPHIAAAKVGDRLTFEKLDSAYENVKALNTDYILTEGAGGWCLPINETDLLSDWVKQQNLNVILVVGMKLGCLNHALLTAAHFKASGVNCVGWIANHVDPTMQEQEANLQTLKNTLPFPLLGITPYTEKTPKLNIYKTLLEILSIHP
ncbi:dethiobiotin synthetase [Pseudoalteromonas lipolytica SCSIO 04301]|jgi:dethiobiotin synthetase|uniref:ATP-dependent dethiobiotin synthetase BioD n=1 Tax=Pseudoalteromonas lipolytica TaxID=570156 RepID=A0ABY1GVX9_9GAMM|nr:dethiobiotin synthase [Pseudoalteromonas lipolytica]EWH07109.1 dethiobiotin synthetase [Pseudoalteromonas lipolytica SCSIO 04301]MBE0350874.1 dethiobiotin synthetase [Pseudoalteromonas lipolytica LMEB 39]SFT92507.1 dethiobiotin synthetase [Pseudoalteromonas lipolytica]